MTFICAICHDKIDTKNEPLIFGKGLPRVTNEYATVHILCFAVRMNIMDNNDKTFRTTYQTRADDQSIYPLENLMPDNRDNDPPDLLQCKVCKQVITNYDSVVYYPECSHRFLHLACVSLLIDLSRRWDCPLCPPQHQSKINSAIERWEAPNKGKFIKLRINERTNEPPIVPDKRMNCEDISTLEAIKSNYPPSNIVNIYKQRLTKTKDTVKFPTPAKYISYILNTSQTHPSLLDFLSKTKYSLTDYKTLGVTQEMLLDFPTNVQTILNRARFPVEYLSLPPWNVSFLRLLLAGMPVSDFCKAAYTANDLNFLRFNMRAFLAAGGTKSDFETLLSTAKIPDNVLFKTFSYTEPIRQALEKETKTHP